MPQNKQNSEVVAKKRCCSNVEWHRINKIVKQWPKKGIVVINITTTPSFGHYFTILFILYHSTLLQYLFEWYSINKIAKLRPKKGIVVMLNGTE
jgi:hypothetical protein